MPSPFDPKNWDDPRAKITVVSRGRPAQMHAYFRLKVWDVLDHPGRRAFGRCFKCRHRGPIHGVYLNFRFGKPLPRGTFLKEIAARTRCSACGHRGENWIEVEAAPGEATAPGGPQA